MKIIKGKTKKTLALLFYGVHGVGKSSMPLKADSPIYIGTEENDELDVHKMERISNWKMLNDQLEWLLTSEHEYKTLVIDTIDGLEQIVQKEILNNHKGKTLNTVFGGWGAGYKAQADMLLEIRDKYLVPLRHQKNMNIILLAHAEKTKHEDPLTLTSYDSYTTSMQNKIKPIFEDWVSAIFFINWEFLKTENSKGEHRAIGSGERIIYSEERPSHVAKNRFNFPYSFEFNLENTWEKIIKHIDNFYSTSIENKDNELLLEISEKIKRIQDDDLKKQIQLSVDRANGKESELKRILKKIEGLL